MKKFLFIISIITVLSSPTVYAQDSATSNTASLLSNYYQVKDALIQSQAGKTSAAAFEFAKVLTSADAETVPAGIRSKLLTDINAIAETKDINQQRARFATFSNNMIELIKVAKLSVAPIYQQYCSMKKASWLSNEKAIRNPYFGSAMLTCGIVKATL